MMNKLRLESLLRHDGRVDPAVLLQKAHLAKMKVEGVTPIPTPLETPKVLM